MAESDTMPTSSSINLPPPPQAYAPGQPQYESATSNGQGNPAHMPPPPLPPVVIPQNSNPIPTAITSPGSGGEAGSILSPGASSGGFVRRAAPEPNKRALYVGGLDPRVTEDVLRQIFETTGHVQNVKIIPDKNLGAVSPASLVLIPRKNRIFSCITRSPFALHTPCFHPATAHGCFSFRVSMW